MPKRDFLSNSDLSAAETTALVDLALRLKRGEESGATLAGRTLGMIFAKSSTRTRVSFEVGMYQLGGHALFLSSRDIQLGRGEPVRDTARVLSRYLDGIMIRTFDHAEVEELARYATIPVINGLTDLLHPCQLLADLLTIRERLGGWEGKTVAWIGDGNNMANSWIECAGTLGFELRLACPEGYEPSREIFERNQPRTRMLITEDPEEAVRGAHVVNTDVWASMGQEGETEARVPGLPGVLGGCRPDETRRAGRDLSALPPRPPGGGSERRGPGGPAVMGLGSGREPAACPEGAPAEPDGWRAGSNRTGRSKRSEVFRRTPHFSLLTVGETDQWQTT